MREKRERLKRQQEKLALKQRGRETPRRQGARRAEFDFLTVIQLKKKKTGQEKHTH